MYPGWMVAWDLSFTIRGASLVAIFLSRTVRRIITQTVITVSFKNHKQFKVPFDKRGYFFMPVKRNQQSINYSNYHTTAAG